MAAATLAPMSRENSAPALRLDGATRIYAIVGDPIAQVKSPVGVTASFQARGENAILIPAHIAGADLGALLDALWRMKNCDGVIVTVPHKFSCFDYCETATERARFLGAVNIMRRSGAGWFGDAVDGLGYLAGMRARCGVVENRRALLVGAGGAGSAIALQLVEEGVAELAIHDPDAQRRESLIQRLAGLNKAKISAGSADPTGFDLVCNASPLGMRDGDPLPVEVEKLAPGMFVACVVTAPAVPPLIAAARARGCKTSTGADMFFGAQEIMVDFLLAGEKAV